MCCLCLGIGVNFRQHDASPSGESFKAASLSGLRTGSVMDVLGAGVVKPSLDLKQGSVMDILGKDNSSPSSVLLTSDAGALVKDNSKSAFGAASSLKSGSVMDVLRGSSSDSSSSTLKQGSKRRSLNLIST